MLPSEIAVGDLANVNTAGIAAGQVLVYNGTGFVAADLPASTVTVKTISSVLTSYTLTLADAGCLLILGNTDANELVIPADVDFPVGTQILIQQAEEYIQFTSATGVTIQAAADELQTAAQYSVAMLIKVAANTWSLSGDII